MKKIFYLSLLSIITLNLISCNNSKDENSEKDSKNTANSEKIGVLIVSHGSPSKKWQNTLIELGKIVRPQIIENELIYDVKSAFMEFATPDIATQLKKFDEEGFSKVIIVPLFLTVSSHTESDIKHIVGLESDPEVLVLLEEEGVEVYKPNAEIIMTPLLEFSEHLKKNVSRRYHEISKAKDNEGIVLIAYGSEPYEQQWIELIEEISIYLKENDNVQNVSYGWCGHLVHYSSNATTDAINQILDKKEHAVVIPLLVSNSERFQGEIIYNGVTAVENYEEKVTYRQDAILPDEDINNWIIEVVNEYAEK